MNTQQRMIQIARRTHRYLFRLAVTAVALFVFSALAHIVASWLPPGESKETFQWVFRHLHTLAFLEDLPLLRLSLMLALTTAVLAMLAAGITMLICLKRKQALSRARRTHRLLAAILAVPLIGFTASGLFHLFYMEYGPVEAEVQQQKLNHAAGIHRDAPPRADALGRAEQASFRHLHMWGFIKPLAGKPGRDAALTCILVVLAMLVMAGYRLRKRH